MKRYQIAFVLVLMVAVATMVTLFAFEIVPFPQQPLKSSEARYAELSDSERQRMVDEVTQRLKDQGYLPKIAGFGYGEKDFHILFYNKADPQALLIVREVIGDLPLKISENVTVVVDFSSALEQVNRNSLRVTISTVLESGKKTVVINNTDPMFRELLQHLNNSTIKRITQKVQTVVEDGRTTTVCVTIPYVWGYVLTFELKDGSKIWFNCATENIWFETDQAIYQASFNPTFHAFLDKTVKEGETPPQIPMKLSPAYALNVSFPSKEGFVAVKKGGSVTLPVTIKSLVSETIKIRLVLVDPWKAPDWKVLPEFVGYEAPRVYLHLNPGETATIQLTIKVSEDAPPGSYTLGVTGELQEPVKDRAGDAVMFELVVD